ncbi:MAG: hypothetical protein LPK02_08795 [Rhodobacterales bacterium]|nr:hypothetical protein [Rhodobacterales bacterium]
MPDDSDRPERFDRQTVWFPDSCSSVVSISIVFEIVEKSPSREDASFRHEHNLVDVSLFSSEFYVLELGVSEDSHTSVMIDFPSWYSIWGGIKIFHDRTRESVYWISYS